MNPEIIERILKIVSRAPSPFNTQPIKWKFASHKIQIWIIKERILAVADSEYRDLHLSVGATFYLLKLALLQEGFEITKVEFKKLNFEKDEELYLECGIKEASLNYVPEIKLIKQHVCYRGGFLKGKGALQFTNPLVKAITDTEMIQQISWLYDRANAHFLSQENFATESWKWLRLSKKHPRYFKDGLNAEMLRVKGHLSKIFMRPGMLNFMGKIKLLSIIVSEGSINQSAEAIVVLLKDPKKTPFQQGEDLMKLWLEIESQGRVLCPITAVIGDEKFEQEAEQILKLDTKILHILRCGVKPKSEKLKLSTRLPLEELQQ